MAYDIPDLIYCAAGNVRYGQIAIDAGFRYGAQLPRKLHHAPYFVDQDWKKPRRDKYMAALAQWRPYMATVLDLEEPEQLEEVLDWAEEAAQYVSEVVVIPKYSGAVAQLPRVIGGAAVRLGYSVPTRYGGTTVPLWEFYGWPVHLLGGDVKAHLKLTHYLDVRSVDGNIAQKVAHHGMTFDGVRWVTLEKYLGGHYEGKDMTYTAFEISCRNIVKAWERKHA